MRIAVSSLSGDFSNAFQVMMGVAANPVFPAESMERERESQLAALRAEKAQPQIVARNLLRAEIYGDHPYGLNPLGREETVLEIKQEELVRTHRACFGWASAAFGFCGDFDSAEILDLIEQGPEDLEKEQSLDQPPVSVRSDFQSRLHI